MSLQTQWDAFGLMLLSGLLLGTLLDLYRILKGQWKLTKWVVALVDLCYWIVAAGWVFGVLMWSTWGELRFYMLLSLFAGFGGYYLWLSRPMISVLLFVIQIVQAVIEFMIKTFHVIIWTPLRFLLGLCGYVLEGIIRVIWTLLKVFVTLLRPFWRPLVPLARPFFPYYHKVVQFVAGLWENIKKLIKHLGKG